MGSTYGHLGLQRFPDLTEGESYQWKDRETRLVCSYDDRTPHHWKKGTWSKTIRNAARRGAAESLMEDRIQEGANKCSQGYSTIDPNYAKESRWNLSSREKWEKVASGQRMQTAT
jgi:hypothetical protein